jgi:uncharacterized protein YndB with AHSA1/START domain
VIDETVRIERRFDAPVERVFRAWGAPDDLVRWAWGSLSREARATVDFREGGAFRVSTRRPDGEEWAFSGAYVEIAPNRRLVHTLVWEAPMGYEAIEERVTVEFDAQQAGTTVTFCHEGVPTEGAREGHREGWSNAFDALAKVVEGETS